MYSVKGFHLFYSVLLNSVFTLLFLYKETNTINECFDRKVQQMTDIRSDVGYTRAWVRLSLERKMLSTHLKELLSDSNLLRLIKFLSFISKLSSVGDCCMK